MVGCSEFTRRNYLKECAQAGMVESQVSQGLPTYQSSARYSGLSIGTPVGITSRAYKAAGALPKSYSRRVGEYSHLTPSRLSGVQQETGMRNPNETSDYLRTTSISPRPRRPNFSRDRNVVMTNPFKLETSSVESYIRSRTPLTDQSTDKSDSDNITQSTPTPEKTLTSQETRPTYTIRNMPLRNLDELRETIGIRRHYSKERNNGNNSYFLDTNYAFELKPSPYSLRKSEEINLSRNFLSRSPSRTPSRFDGENSTTITRANTNT